MVLIEDWLRRTLRWPLQRLAVASADASFRRYLRAWRADGSTAIVMDAPPGREDVAPYLRVSGLLAAAGVHVPAIAAADPAQGLILMEDLGDTHMLAGLRAGADAGQLYGDALAALAGLQDRGRERAVELPPYDAPVLLREMQLLPEWFCTRHLRLAPSPALHGLLADTMRLLCDSALAQPRVLVHRDYHSRNLMLTARDSPGVIDFQDALHGPVTYDPVSLLKDCYVEWPREQVLDWLRAHRRELLRRGVAAGRDDAEFTRWFDLMGLQRHLKVLGIFARLWYRDGKRGYLADLPLTLKYAIEAAALFPELAAFHAWLEREARPALLAANVREGA